LRATTSTTGPFITNSQATPEGTLTQSFEYKKVGTLLKITPNINELNKVEMKVEIKADQIRPGEVLFGGLITDSRQFNTQVAVESGDTIVIGGIMRETDSKATRGVPILEKVPVANLVFRKKDTKRETTELIAFITPIVLKDPEADAAVTRAAAAAVKHITKWVPYEGNMNPLAQPPTETVEEPVDGPVVEKKKPWFRRRKK
jgi:type II secretory pathway component GspD/PulD (secretin)